MDRGGRPSTNLFFSTVLLVAVCWASGCNEQAPAPTSLPCPLGGIQLMLVDAGPAPPPQTPPTGGGECSGGACGTPQWSCTSSTCKYRTYTDQVANFERYACARPQICPDMDVQTIRHDISTGARVMHVLLTNCSTGNQDLRIDKVEVYGDDRCSFSNVTASDISPKLVAPGEAAAVRITYDPGATGEDHAVLTVHSNAQNSARLPLRLCALAIGSSTTPPDSGAWPTLDKLRCQGSTNLAACHK
jgi:hypothetical protein